MPGACPPRRCCVGSRSWSSAPPMSSRRPMRSLPTATSWTTSTCSLPARRLPLRNPRRLRRHLEPSRCQGEHRCRPCTTPRRRRRASGICPRGGQHHPPRLPRPRQRTRGGSPRQRLQSSRINPPRLPHAPLLALAAPAAAAPPRTSCGTSWSALAWPSMGGSPSAPPPRPARAFGTLASRSSMRWSARGTPSRTTANSASPMRCSCAISASASRRRAARSGRARPPAPSGTALASAGCSRWSTSASDAWMRRPRSPARLRR
mmetsp:Transcript_44559/g.129567  ORF Transcript_44559/g.129567 Transcript_44559/m.129567 type:complete len:262 (+) Transcript_44559:1686-2471(+)